jgi:hypothetical protein
MTIRWDDRDAAFSASEPCRRRVIGVAIGQEKGVDVAMRPESGDFAHDWEHVFLLGKARPDSRRSNRPPSGKAPIGWWFVAGYPVRIHPVLVGERGHLDNRPSWRVPPVWEAPSGESENQFPTSAGPR